MEQSTSTNPHLAATKWDFDRIVRNCSSTDPDTVEAALDQFRLRRRTLNEQERRTAHEIAERIYASPLNITVRDAARDLIEALGE